MTDSIAAIAAEMRDIHDHYSSAIIARWADRLERIAHTQAASAGEPVAICHCTCHNDPLYCRKCKECSCLAK